MFTLNVKLKNAEEFAEFKSLLYSYGCRVSMIIGGHVVAKPLITCSPYITPLDDITVNFNSESVNEFMQMIRDLNQYIAREQNTYTQTAINRVREMEEESVAGE